MAGGKPAVDEINRRLLGSKAFTVESPCVMVDNEAVASFAVETSETIEMLGDLRRLNEEAKIERKTLIGHGGATRIVGGAIGMAKLSLEADRAFVKFGSDGELWNAGGVAMGLGDAPGMDMTEALMPKDALLIASEMM